MSKVMKAYIEIILHNYEWVIGISGLIANLSPLELLEINTPLSTHKKRSKNHPKVVLVVLNGPARKQLVEDILSSL